MSGYAQQAGSGQAQQAEGVAGAFDRSRQLFEEVVAGLADPGCGEVTHAQLEDQLTERCRELTRGLLQDHLDLRACREQRRLEVVAGADGVGRARAEKGHQRDLGTVFGTVAVTPDRLPRARRDQPLPGGRGVEPARGQAFPRVAAAAHPRQPGVQERLVLEESRCRHVLPAVSCSGQAPRAQSLAGHANRAPRSKSKYRSNEVRSTSNSLRVTRHGLLHPDAAVNTWSTRRLRLVAGTLC